MKKILYILFSTLIVIPALAEDTGSPKITVNFVDNNGNPIKNTTVILDGKEYTTDKKGDIIISISDGNQPSNTPSIKIEGFETKSNQRIVNKTQITMTRSPEITVSFVDNTGNPIKNTKVTLDGKEYTTDKKGDIIISISDGNQPSNTPSIKIEGFETKSNQRIVNKAQITMTRCKSDSTKPECNCDPMPDNATKAHREYKEDTKQEVCIIDECSDGYTTSPDQLSCIELTLSEEDSNKTPEEQQENAGTTQGTEKSTEPILSEEDSNKKIEELQENADAMKEKEQSDANKLLGAASIGAMGIGGMQALSALSEQRADEDAELDMSAYLATFRCDFGQGRNIQGGQTGIVLPGGNQLFSLYNEYKTLAADLKTRKEALGLTPGIESETILDKANTGLYDDIGSGRSDGAYTSLATALSNPNSADAAEWAAQREDTATQLQRGLITVGVGAAASIIGNLAINENKKAAQESSDEIIAKFEPLKTLENAIKALPNQEANAKCPEDATGNYPDCDCKEQKKAYNNNTNTCETCPGDKIGKGSKCECPDGTVPGDNDTCQEAKTPINPQCDIHDSNIKVNPNTGECSCVNGYIPTEDGKNCECPSATHEINNGLCIEKAEPVTVVPGKTVLPAKNLFALGSYDLTSQALLTIGEFAGNVKTQMGTDTNYCITVVGHTDETGTNAINEPLSKNRANAVKKALTEADLSGTNIQTSGIASTECTSKFRQNADGCTANNKNCEACRKVEITFSTTSCSNS